MKDSKSKITNYNTTKNRVLPSFFIPTNSSVSCPATTTADRKQRSKNIKKYSVRKLIPRDVKCFDIQNTHINMFRLKF